MAEFQEVIHQTKRICKSVNGNCGKCLLGAFSCPNNARFDSTDEQKFIEFANAVMTWAAEHPEPVYETWFEYLLRIGVIPENAPAGGEYQWIVESIKHKHISNDIAESLKLHPKEAQKKARETQTDMGLESDMYFDPVYWMPLPEPPKEG